MDAPTGSGLTVLAVLLALCAPTYAADTPDDFKSQVDQALSAQLKDPDSRKIEILSQPIGGLVCGTINAKNSYGGYVGKQRFFVSFDASKKVHEAMILDTRSFNTIVRHHGEPKRPSYEDRYYLILSDCGFISNPAPPVH